MSGKKIIVTAEIPEEFLEDWRVFVVIRGGEVLVPRPKKGEKNAEHTDRSEQPPLRGTREA